MAYSTPSTAYSRDLGDELRRLRESTTNLNGNALAIRLGWDPSKVSNIEHGKARPSEVDLVQFLTMCGKDTDYLENFKRRYHYAFEEYIVQAPGTLRTTVMAESSARKIASYETLVVPGLIQTPEYADCLCRAAGIAAEEEIPGLVQGRTDRQSILRRHDRPDCVFYIHEIALQQQVGDLQVMEDQYTRLLFHSHIVRLVPESVIATSAGFVLWEFEKAKSISYSETEFARVFVQDPGAVARTRDHFNHLSKVALDQEQTQNKLLEYIGKPREELDRSRIRSAWGPIAPHHTHDTRRVPPRSTLLGRSDIFARLRRGARVQHPCLACARSSPPSDQLAARNSSHVWVPWSPFKVRFCPPR